MDDYGSRAAGYVRQEFPQAQAAFLGGSAGAGLATSTSDLDVVVVLGAPWDDVAFVETTTYHGQLVEAFVYGRVGLVPWLEKGRDDRRPVVDRLIGEGLPLLGTVLEDELAGASRTVLDDGPKPLSDNGIRMRRYALSALVDDLSDATDPTTTVVVASMAWTAAAELALLLDGQWLGTGKWLVRGLRVAGDRFGLVDVAPCIVTDPTRVGAAARQVLDAAGGCLQDGMIRGVRPAAL